MNGNSESSGGWSWLWNLLIILFVVGLLIAIAIPNFVGSRQIKINFIWNNLRQIDAAKNQWAFEHGFTNVEQFLQLTNKPTEDALKPYLYKDDKSYVRPVAGETYTINPMNKSPEAKLTREIEMPWPKGSIIRFSENPKLNANLEITFPDGTKTYY